MNSSPINYLNPQESRTHSPSARSSAPAVAFAMGIGIVAELEGSGQGITLTTLDYVSSRSGVSFQWMLYMLIIDTFYLYILSWYLEKVWYRDFGVPFRVFPPLCPPAG